MAMRLLTLDYVTQNTAEARKWVEGHPAIRDKEQQNSCPPFWLDIIEPDEEAFDWLADCFQFHPLTIEDLRSPNERGKLETYEGYIFVIAHSVFVEGPPTPGQPQRQGETPPAVAGLPPGQTEHGGSRPLPTGTTKTREARRLALLPLHRDQPTPADTPICDVDSHELHAYLSKSYLVTVHSAGMECVDKIWKRVDSLRGEDHRLFEHGLDYLLYRLLDSAVDTFFTTLQVTADQIDHLEDAVVDRPERRLLEDVFTVKHNLTAIRRFAIPMREAMNVLSSDEIAYVQPPTRVYMRDVHNLLVAVAELADTQHDSSSGVLDAYLSSVNNSLSQIMKRMTLIATIFMPISFIVGFGGMNFVKFMPFDDPIFFWLLIASLVIVPGVMLGWFWRNRWT